LRRRLGTLFAVTFVTVACSSNGTPATSESGSSRSAPASVRTTPVPELVGRWERVTTCPELVDELEKAGFGTLVAQVWVGQTSASGRSSFKPGSPKPTKTQPCTGAIPRVHSHFFNEFGQFGSVDWTGKQVDDGPYRIVDDDTVVIGNTTFRYRIANGDTLMLEPVISEAMKNETLAHPLEFTEAFWAVTVAYASHTWKRVSCSEWC
jgi:hypothetical protein